MLFVSDQDAVLRDVSEECGTPLSSEYVSEDRRSRNVTTVIGDAEPTRFEKCPVPLW